MRINKLELKNYRVHDSLEVEFSKGINLLIGENGSGKSSILEAIGIAMFGSHPRTSQKEAIKNGEKYGSIKIEFTGNDNLEYIVEKKLGKQGHFLYKKDDELEKLTTKDEIIKKIRNLSGINENSDKIYDNVILAKQNKIVDIFSATSKDRESIFNEIFDTQIYRQMYLNYTLVVKRTYEDEEVKINGLIENITENLADGVTLEANFKSKNNEFDILKKENELNEKLREKYKDELISLDKLRLQIENIESNLKLINDSLKNNEITLNTYENDLKKSKKDLNIVNENKEKYNEYIKLEEVIKKQQLEKNELLAIKEKINKKENEKLKLKEKITINENDNKNEKENIKKIDDEVIKINKEIIENKNFLDAELKKEIELNNTYNKVKENNSKFNKIFNEIKDLNEKVKSLNVLVKKFENNEFNEKEVIDEINEKNKEMDIFKIKEEEKHKLENEFVKLNALIDQNNKANEALSDKICPFLKEECLNLSGKNNSSEYFIQRDTELKNESNELKINLKKYDNLINDKERVDNAIKILKINSENFNKESLRNEENILKIDKIKLEVSKRLFEINKILSENLEIKDLELKKDEFNREISKLETNRASLRIVEYKKLTEKFNSKKEQLENDKISKLSLIESRKLNNKKYLVEIGVINGLLNSLKEKIVRLDDLEVELKVNDGKLNEFKIPYDLYRDHIVNSKTVDEKIKKISKLTGTKIKLEKDITLKTTDKENLIKIYSEEKFNSIKENLEKIILKLEDSNTKILKFNEEISLLKNQIEKYNKDIIAIEKFKVEFNIINQKLTLIEKFRNNINSMGKEVADYMLREIEVKATENFREITGRSESVKWISTEKEAYAVYLKELDMERSFNVLSGGEQVAVALSIRAALSTTLSKANFSIYDEPTNNLDKERKKSLADSLNIILKGIDQSIIVTHDDTFREMAENIIELKWE